MSVARESGWPVAVGSLFVAYAIGQAIQVSNGAGHPVAFRWLGAAIVVFLVTVLFGRTSRPAPRWAEPLVLVLGGLAVLSQLRELGSVPPAMYLQNTNLFDFSALLVVFGALGLAVLARSGLRYQRVVALAWLASFFMLCRWLLEKSPNPAIDVFTFSNESLDALMKGVNPYGAGMKMRNIYGHITFYGPKIADNQWVYAGFPYPPVSLLFAGVGRIFGDIRWANVGCLMLAGLAWAMSRNRLAIVAGLVYLTTPRVLFMLEQAWTDVYIIGILAVALWSAKAWPRGLPYVLGILFSLKQYSVFWVPLLPLLFDPAWSRRQQLIFVAKVAATGLALNLPWVFWEPAIARNLINDEGLPFRLDALSFLSLTAENGVPRVPFRSQFGLVLLSYVLMWWRGPRGPAAFAFGASMMMCLFFASSKHAFCNHYFLVVGTACAALAATRLEHRVEGQT